MKKRLICFLAALCLFFTAVLCLPNLVHAQSSSAPNIGQVVSGFEVSQTVFDSVTKSTKILFCHQATGTKLLFIKNNDKNGGFAVKFNTPTDNNKGINHIIEHAVLSGSEKYPCKDTVYDVTNTTYVSMANGATSQNSTIFPICSVNEKQLLKAADIYLDAVFHPLVLKDKRIFEREGIRYDLSSESSKLCYNGIVYNEMQGGSADIESAAVRNAIKAIFPDSNQANNAGGDPAEIRKLTYEEFVDTYNRNYHPSNCLMVLYGDVNYVPFLEMIDKGYLSSFSKRPYNIDRDNQKPFYGLRQKTFTFPAGKDSGSNQDSVIDLVFATEDITKMGFQNYTELAIAISLLGFDSSDIKKAMFKSKIAESYTIGISSGSFQPTIHFVATIADPSRKKDFYNLVIRELKKTVEKGLDTEIVKSSLRSLEFKQSLGNGSDSALDQINKACLYDTCLGDCLIDEVQYYKNIVAKLQDKSLEKIISKYIINNRFAALTVTAPKAGLLEKKQKALEKALKLKKDSMTKADIQELVKKTEDFNQWNTTKTSDDVLKSLKAVSLNEISPTIKQREIKETTIDGSKLLAATADINSVSMSELRFNLSHLGTDELLYLKFYSDMLENRTATGKRTESQVVNECTRYAYSMTSDVAPYMDDKNDSSAHPDFSLRYYGFEDEYVKTFDLVYDILLQSKLSDITVYGTRTIANIKAHYYSQFKEPSNLAIYRCMAYTSPTYRYYNYLNGLDYYNFILSLEKKLNSNPKEVAAKIEEIRKKAFNKNNLTILFAGSDSAQEKYKSSLKGFVEKLPDKTYQKAVYTLPVPAKREAIKSDSTVQYVSINASLSDNSVLKSGKADVILNILNNILLIPEIRLKGGAYDASAFMEYNNYVAYTYRDSNYQNSLKTINETDEFLKTLSANMTVDALESYKLSVFAQANRNVGEIYDAFIALKNKFTGISIEDRLKTLEEMKETTVSDVERYAEILKKLNDSMNYIVVASPSEIEKNKNMFDKVISLY